MFFAPLFQKTKDHIFPTFPLFESLFVVGYLRMDFTYNIRTNKTRLLYPLCRQVQVDGRTEPPHEWENAHLFSQTAPGGYRPTTIEKEFIRDVKLQIRGRGRLTSSFIAYFSKNRPNGMLHCNFFQQKSQHGYFHRRRLNLFPIAK